MAKVSDLECNVLRPGDSLGEWDRFVDLSPQGCIFCRSWWLDALCAGQFEILTVQKGGRIVAGMPLPRGKKLIWSTITMPPLTQTLGVLLEPQEEGKYESRLSHEMTVLRAVVAAIPRTDVFAVNMHHSFANWLPFYWAGYSQTTRYTYVLDDLSDLEAVFSNMNPTLRNKVRKAKKAGIEIEESDDIEVFLRLNTKTYARQGMRVPYSAQCVRQLDAACAQRGARRILLAKDTQGRIHSAVYLVFDKKCMYNLMQGGDPEFRSSGGNPLAMWRSIELAHELRVGYDFEGSVMQNVESFFRAFGGELKPYFEISRYASWTARLATGLRGLAARARGKRPASVLISANQNRPGLAARARGKRPAGG